MLEEMSEVLEHNYRLFNSRAFLDGAWSELLGNLQTAVESAPVLQDWPAIRGTRTKSIAAPGHTVPEPLMDKVENSIES